MASQEGFAFACAVFVKIVCYRHLLPVHLYSVVLISCLWSRAVCVLCFFSSCFCREGEEAVVAVAVAVAASGAQPERGTSTPSGDRSRNTVVVVVVVGA